MSSINLLFANTLTPDMGAWCCEQLRVWTSAAITFHQLLSSGLKPEPDLTGATCVFLPGHSTALCHHGRTAACSGVSKCGAALLPPNQVRVSLQPECRTPVEQQRLGWHLWGTHERNTELASELQWTRILWSSSVLLFIWGLECLYTKHTFRIQDPMLPMRSCIASLYAALLHVCIAAYLCRLQTRCSCHWAKSEKVREKKSHGRNGNKEVLCLEREKRTE